VVVEEDEEDGAGAVPTINADNVPDQA